MGVLKLEVWLLVFCTDAKFLTSSIKEANVYAKVMQSDG